MEGFKTKERVRHASETLSIDAAKEVLRDIKDIKVVDERVEALEELLRAFEPDADGRKLHGPRADFFEALGQLYLFEKTLAEKGF